MKITPGESWTWSYQSVDGDNYLGILLTLDNSKRYFFKTNFKAQHLQSFPESGTPFCILDIQLLNDFMEGLTAIGVHDESATDTVSINVELALNAVACARFVRSPRKVNKSVFLEYGGEPFKVHRGLVVSLYTTEKRVADFIVLDTEEQARANPGNAYRVMLLNKRLYVGSRAILVGCVSLVPREVLCPFRCHKRLSPNKESSA